VSGEALKLKFSKDGSEILVKKGEVCRFPGEEPISSELLSGAVTDLNLIFKRGQVNAEAQVLKLPSKPKSIQLEGGVSFLFAISGSLAISIYPGEEEFVLKEGDTLRIIGPARGEERLVLLEPKKRDSLVALIELELKS
jgi:environmental stress-induced protein Ves